jgi:hypothetical protein
MIRRLSLITGLALAAAAPLAAQAYDGVFIAVSTPEFGIRIGAPMHGPRVYAPVPVFVPTPVYPPVVYAPSPVVYAPMPAMIPAVRLAYPVPVFVSRHRVVYRHAYVPPPRTVVPHGYRPHQQAYEGQHAGYRMPPGHARRHSENGRYQ